MTSHLPRIIVLSPGSLVDPGVVVAGCRTGALGAFDFGLSFDLEWVAAAALGASGYAGGREFGLRVPAEALGPEWLAGMPDRLGVVIVTEGAETDWARARATLQPSGRRNGRGHLAGLGAGGGAGRVRGADRRRARGGRTRVGRVVVHLAPGDCQSRGCAGLGPRGDRAEVGRGMRGGGGSGGGPRRGAAADSRVAARRPRPRVR